MRFHLFAVPINVKWSFWLVALILWPFPGRTMLRVEVLPFLGAWVAVVFTSVVAHELGHALVARRQGASVGVTLYALGGSTRWETKDRLGPWRRVMIAAAGSLTGFGLGGIAFLLGEFGWPPDRESLIAFSLDVFWRVNLLWGALNWLPVRPLDGGHMFAGVLQGTLGDRGTVVANVLFPLFALAGGVWAWQNGLVVATLFAGFLLVHEVTAWRGVGGEGAEPQTGVTRASDGEDPPELG